MDLYEACENGNEERVVEVLIYGEQGLVPTARTRDGASLVNVFATERSRLAASAKKLLLTPRDVLRARGTAGRTPLLAACMGAQLGVARLLLGESCVVYFTSRRADETEALLAPLVAAYTSFATASSSSQDHEYFRVTITERPEVHGGSSVPMAVVRFPPAFAVAPQELLDGVTHVDVFGNTPLQCVSCFGCGTTERHIDDGLALAQELLRHGDQPNVPKTANRWTPLHWAAYHGNHELCGILLYPPTEDAKPLGPTQRSIPLMVNDANLFAADVAGRRGLVLAAEMQMLRSIAPHDRDAYARWRLRLDHVATLRLMVREFLEHATSLVRYVHDMNARLPLIVDKKKKHRHRRQKLFSCADAIRYGQHLLYWMGCFGLESDVRALLEMQLELPTDVAAILDNATPPSSTGAFTIVHLRPLYVCSCEENKLQSVLHAVAVHGQDGIVRLLLSQMLYEQQHPQAAAHINPLSHLQHKKTERIKPTKHTAAVAPSTPSTPVAVTKPTEDPTKLDVLPFVDLGWRNYRLESPLFLAVLYLRDDVVATFDGFLSTASRAWELGNCNVEGSYIHHVASDAAKRTLDVVKAPDALRHASYVLLFDGLTKRPFKESVIEAMREESIVAPSLCVTPFGHTLTPPSFGGLRPSTLTDYVVVGATGDVLVHHAQVLQLKIKHRGSTVRSKYNAATPHVFEPFRSLQRQQVVLDIIQKNVQLKKHLKQRNLQAIFPLHDASGCENIMRHWVRTDARQRIFQPFVGNSLSQFLLEKRTHQYEMLWPLLTYFGEKHAFYYAFLLFYTVWLVVLAVPGALCQCAWSLGHAQYASPLFAILTSLWATLFVERWKRKRSEIQSTFGNFKRNRSEQAPEFYGDFQVDAPERGVVDTTFPKSLQLARVYAGLPLLFTMAGLAVAIFVGVKLNASSTAIIESVFPWLSPQLAKYVIPVLNAVSMLVLDNLYTQVAVALTQWENHRTVWEFESMLATKLFWFKFLNAFISLFWVAFVDRDAPALRTQLVIIMGARQIWYMIQRSIVPLVTVARAWRSAGFVLPKGTSWFTLTHEWYDATLPTPVMGHSGSTPPPIVQLQERMQPCDFLLGKQMEVVLHFGYITMFVSVLPVAPLLALVSVVVSTRLDVACCTQAKRRPPFESETEVSTFMSILEFMSFAAVAVNCAVLFFTTMDDLDSLLAAVGTTWAALSATETYIHKLWVLLVLEHLVLGLKALLSLTIDDAASWVQNDEDRENDGARGPSNSRAQDTSDIVVGNMVLPPLFPSAEKPAPVTSPSSSLVQVLANKYDLAVKERDAATERERQLQQQLREVRQRLDDLAAQKSLSLTTSDRPTFNSELTMTTSTATTTFARSCWICHVLHAPRDTSAEKRCLSCRRFFCSACDRVVHLDDLGVREPTHFRVNAQATVAVSDADECYVGSAVSETIVIDPELRALVVEYFSETSVADTDVTHAIDSVLIRCQGNEALVIRYLRNAQRQREFHRASDKLAPLDKNV